MDKVASGKVPLYERVCVSIIYSSVSQVSVVCFCLLAAVLLMAKDQKMANVPGGGWTTLVALK